MRVGTGMVFWLVIHHEKQLPTQTFNNYKHPATKMQETRQLSGTARFASYVPRLLEHSRLFQVRIRRNVLFVLLDFELVGKVLNFLQHRRHAHAAILILGAFHCRLLGFGENDGSLDNGSFC